DLGLITQNQYQYLLRIMQKKGWRKNEPLDNILKTKEPSLLRDAVEMLLVNDIFTVAEFIKELADEGLAMDNREVETLLNLPAGMLKIEKGKQDSKIVTLRQKKEKAGFSY